MNLRFMDHLRHHHAGRHRGRGHHGFFGLNAHFGASPGGPGGIGGGPGGLGPGRKLSSADLQLLLLALLAEQPSHGYELINALAERSGGYYRPSPGMVYPALTYIEEIGHASVEVEGTKKRYSITAEGRAFVEKNRTSVDTLLRQLAWLDERMDHLRQAMGQEEEDAGGAENDRFGPGRWGHAIVELRTARHNLKAALVGKINAGAEVQRKVAEILERAAQEIRGA